MTPIRVAYTVFNPSGLGAAGGYNPNNPLNGASGSTTVHEDEAEMNAFIRWANDTGGVGGHRIIGYPIQMSEADLPQSSRAAKCVQATEDDHATVYIDDNGFFTPEDFACIAEHHALYIGWADTVDQTFMRQYAPYITTTLPSANRAAAILVNGLNRGGYFDSQSKVGVVVDDLPVMHEVYTYAMAPALRSIGIVPKDVEYISPTDENQQQSEAAGAVLHFRTDGVNRVVMLANILVFESLSSEAQSQGYNPRYGIGDYQLLSTGSTSFAQTSAMQNAMIVSSIPAAVQNANHLTTQSTSKNYGYTTGPNDPPGLQFCLDTMSKLEGQDFHKGNSPRSPYFVEYCDHFFLWLEAARKVANDYSPATWAEGLAELGSGYASAQVHETKFGPSLSDGAADYRIGVFSGQADTSCACATAMYQTWFPTPYPTDPR